MKILSRNTRLLLRLAALTALMAPGANGQEDASVSMKSDKTGTNPVNFQHELRVYNEYLELNADGDG